VLRSLFIYIIVSIASLGVLTLANAETIILQSGQKIEGQIIERTELRVMVDVQGTPRTLYLGEIASIDGKNVEIPQPKVEEPSPAVVKKMDAPVDTDEKISLDRFMTKRNPGAPASVTPPKKALPAPPIPPKTGTKPQEPSGTGTNVTEANKNVLVTPDGGIIVVGPDSLVKYDKDLNIIKKVDLKTANPAASR
jgi:hypothetical protein